MKNSYLYICGVGFMLIGSWGKVSFSASKLWTSSVAAQNDPIVTKEFILYGTVLSWNVLSK